jgi:hypothetical protein
VAFGIGPVVVAQEPATRPAGGAATVSGEKYILRTYEVGDLVINIQDHPYSEAMDRQLPSAPGSGMGGGMGGGGGGMFSIPDEAGELSSHRRASAPVVLAQFGGGGRGGGGMGEAGSEAPSASISISDLVRVLTNTVMADTWAVNGGGDGNVEPLGTTLVVWQMPSVHQQIGQLLENLREGSAERRTLTIDARWLMLTSDELDALIAADENGQPQVNREKLNELTRKPDSIRGITNCLSSQLVYVVSGTMKNVVSTFIPVVGSADRLNGDLQLAVDKRSARMQLVSDAQPDTARRDTRVGYQPIVTNLNFGAVLEIRPTLIPLAGSEKAAMVDLKSTVTVAADSADAGKTVEGGVTPAVDRVSIQTQDFATTLRVPLGKPTLIGGMTDNPASATAAGDGRTNANEAKPAATEKPQRYLVLEVR